MNFVLKLNDENDEFCTKITTTYMCRRCRRSCASVFIYLETKILQQTIKILSAGTTWFWGDQVPFSTDTFNTIRQSGILWCVNLLDTQHDGLLENTMGFYGKQRGFASRSGPTGISDKRFFRRLAFTVFVQGIGMDGCFLVIGAIFAPYFSRFSAVFQSGFHTVSGASTKAVIQSHCDPIVVGFYIKQQLVWNR